MILPFSHITRMLLKQNIIALSFDTGGNHADITGLQFYRDERRAVERLRWRAADRSIDLDFGHNPGRLNHNRSVCREERLALVSRRRGDFISSDLRLAKNAPLISYACSARVAGTALKIGTRGDRRYIKEEARLSMI